MTLGQRLKAWRDEQKKTQREAAATAGISQDAWCKYERGGMVPRASAIVKLVELTRGSRYALKLEHFADADARLRSRMGTDG